MAKETKHDFLYEDDKSPHDLVSDLCTYEDYIDTAKYLEWQARVIRKFAEALEDA